MLHQIFCFGAWMLHKDKKSSLPAFPAHTFSSGAESDHCLALSFDET